MKPKLGRIKFSKKGISLKTQWFKLKEPNLVPGKMKGEILLNTSYENYLSIYRLLALLTTTMKL